MGFAGSPGTARPASPAGRSRRARVLLALACVAAAAGLHKGCCEWRTLEYAASEEPIADARALLSVRKVRHAEGNAARWDEQDRVLRAYDEAWRDCYLEVNGAPEAGSPLDRCLEGRPYTRPTPTAQAVALGECELALHGSLRRAEGIRACLRRGGETDFHLPRWSFERIGVRFEGPYVTETALFAENWLGRAAWDRALGIAFGVALPALLVMGALALALRRPG
jgi:hypothetical protein